MNIRSIPPSFTIDDLLSIAAQTLRHYRLDPTGIVALQDKAQSSDPQGTCHSNRALIHDQRWNCARSWIHGISHWGRVLENGTHLAGLTGANIRVVQLFALFHDSRRMNDHRDPEHGARGAALAGEMNGKLFKLSPEELALLQDACTRHTMGFTEADVTVQTCWDADRLDLPRVGKIPVPDRLCTEPARDKAFMVLTRRLSISNHLTPFTIELRKLLA